MNNNLKYPFPFIGAGYGQYFEWFEMSLIFVEAPSKKSKKAIIGSAPEPIRPSPSDFKNRHLRVFSEQFVNVYIQETYGQEDDDVYSEYEATKEASDAFDEHLNKWLEEVHEICPIVAAYRREDLEAGGTALSEWHDISGEMLRPLIKNYLEDNVQDKDLESVIIGALLYYYKKDPLALRILEKCMTPDLFMELNQDETHSKLLQTKEAEKGILKILSEIEFDDTPLGSELTLYAARSDSDKMKTELLELLKKQSIQSIHWINYYWYNNHLLKTGFSENLVKGYWVLMDALESSDKQLIDLTAYNNMIACCARETFSEVTEERMKRAVKLGEKHASKNPLIYWGIFTILCELNELDKALAPVKAYFKSQDSNKSFLKGEIQNKQEYKAFRETEAGNDFIKGL